MLRVAIPSLNPMVTGALWTIPPIRYWASMLKFVGNPFLAIEMGS